MKLFRSIYKHIIAVAPRLLFMALAFVVMAGALSSCRSGKGHSVRRGGRVERHAGGPDLRRDLDMIHGVRRAIVEEALSWEGTPYRYANSDKGRGTDCSGMVLRVYEDVAEIKLPRNSGKQMEYCKRIRTKDVRPGDLAFFATGSDSGKVSHVGLMIDDRYFIHASAKKGVVISDITTPYYQRTLIGFGRVPGL